MHAVPVGPAEPAQTEARAIHSGMTNDAHRAGSTGQARLWLAGRVALVTGASAGIGRAIALELVAQGSRVVINARREDRLLAFAEELNRGRPGPVAAIAPGDASEQRVIDSCFEIAKQKLRAPIDAVVVNAGRGLSGSVLTSDPAQWDEMIRTNLVGAARLMRTAGNTLLAQVVDSDPSAWLRVKRDIVVIGSVVGRHVSPFSSMYGATKFGLHGMTEGLRREVAPKGVRVSLVEPGFVISEFQGVAGYTNEWFKGMLDKVGPALEPEDVARSVAFILAQPSHVHVSDLMVRPTRQEYP